MEMKDLGKVTKCMNPEKDCQNVPDPASAHIVVYQGAPLVLCKECGPTFQLRRFKGVKYIIPAFRC